MARPRTNGPRSLMRTTTERPFARFVTRARVPIGSERCAAVNSFASKRPPLAVRLPSKLSPYHDATVTWPPPAGRAGGGVTRGAEHAVAPVTITTSVARASRRRMAGTVAGALAVVAGSAPPHVHLLPSRRDRRGDTTDRRLRRHAHARRSHGGGRRRGRQRGESFAARRGRRRRRHSSQGRARDRRG